MLFGSLKSDFDLAFQLPNYQGRKSSPKVNCISSLVIPSGSEESAVDFHELSWPQALIDNLPNSFPW